MKPIKDLSVVLSKRNCHNSAKGNRAIYTRKNKTRLSLVASHFRRNVPFIRKVRVLFKRHLTFPRINGPGASLYKQLAASRKRLLI